MNLTSEFVDPTCLGLVGVLLPKGVLNFFLSQKGGDIGEMTLVVDGSGVGCLIGY